VADFRFWDNLFSSGKRKICRSDKMQAQKKHPFSDACVFRIILF
jgi:hypothetical protein